MARFEMSYWIEQGNVGFKDLQPLFTGFYDVQEAIVKSIYNPPPDVNQSRIDLKRDSFVPQELYVYCLDWMSVLEILHCKSFWIFPTDLVNLRIYYLCQT